MVSVLYQKNIHFVRKLYWQLLSNIKCHPRGVEILWLSHFTKNLIKVFPPPYWALITLILNTSPEKEITGSDVGCSRQLFGQSIFIGMMNIQYECQWWYTKHIQATIQVLPCTLQHKIHINAFNSSYDSCLQVINVGHLSVVYMILLNICNFGRKRNLGVFLWLNFLDW